MKFPRDTTAYFRYLFSSTLFIYNNVTLESEVNAVTTKVHQAKSYQLGKSD